MKRNKCEATNYAYTWPFAMIHYFNNNNKNQTIMSQIDIDTLSSNDILNAYSELTEKEADVLTRYIRNGETLKSISEDYGVTVSRVGSVRDKALRKLIARIRKRKNDLRDKESLLNYMLVENSGGKIKTGEPVFIEQLRLPIRAENCLYRAGIKTIEQLKKLSSNDLYKIRNMGKKSYTDIVDKLDSIGIEHNFKPWAECTK